MTAIVTSSPSAQLTPSLTIENGQVTTTSLQIADHFGKEHRSVLLAIRRLECSPEFRLHNFVQSSYINEQGKKQPCYRITRDGFVFLAMGFTGKEAAQWKEAYITAFNRMERELVEKQPYSVHPQQALSAQQADALRNLITSYAKSFPKEVQAEFTIKAWSKLKSHFKVAYRDIPANEYEEAVSIIARHIDAYNERARTPQFITIDRTQLETLWFDLGQMRDRLNAMASDPRLIHQGAPLGV